MTDSVLYAFLSGSMFFVGIALTCLCVCVRLWTRKGRVGFVANVGIASGSVLLVSSGTPLAMWLYAAWGAALFATVLPWKHSGRAKLMTGIFCGASAIPIGLELPHHLSSRIAIEGCDGLYVVGDSLSLGAESPGKNWPEILGEEIGLVASNLSVPGATVDSALQNAERIDSQTPLIILEIGGNDLLSGTRNFEESLDRLLRAVCKEGRRVVMFELPLPPFSNRYGAAQRRLAQQYGVALIPKHCLAGVLTAPGATVDGLHLPTQVTTC